MIMPKILVIDDKKDNLISISALLKTVLPECDSITALSGIEGIEKTVSERPDTILLDIKMPGMDGFEVLSWLKKDPRTQHIPVILITAIHTDPESRIRGLETGADAFLAKPIDEYVLAAQVKTALRIKAAEDLLREKNIFLTDAVEYSTKKMIASDQRYQILFNSASDAIIIHDLVGNILEINEETCRLLKYYAAELAQKKFFEISTTVSADRFNQLMKELSVKGFLSFKANLFTKDNREVTVEVKSRRVDFDGNVTVISIARDVSEREKIAQEKEKLRVKLEHSQRMEAIGTLAGGIAHDFNNLLFPISGYAEMLLQDLSPGTFAQHSANNILAAARRASELVQQILMFSRQVEQVNTVLYVQLLLKEALKLIRAALPTTIEIRTDIDKNVRPIFGDPTKIHQIIMNLCTNAYHAMIENGGLLEVSLKEFKGFPVDVDNGSLTSEPDYVKLTVRDTGIGIPPEILDQIFNPFFTTKKQGEGTGLGLSTVHGIVKELRGEITVDSVPGAGTEFNIYFPVPEQQQQIADEDTQHYMPKGNEHILLVDDEDAIIRMEKRMIERLGYKVTAFNSSREALKVFKNNPDAFQLVLTDMTMPQMTGDVMARKMLQVKPGLPIIILSGYSEKIDRTSVAEIGIFCLIEKPARQKNLAECIRNALDEA